MINKTTSGAGAYLKKYKVGKAQWGNYILILLEFKISKPQIVCMCTYICVYTNT